MYGRLDTLALDIETVVSELITNSIKASARQIALSIDGHHKTLRISATDDAPGLPVLQRPGTDAEGGRGLIIVNALALRWGVRSDGVGKTVWADLLVPGSAVPTFTCTLGSGGLS